MDFGSDGIQLTLGKHPIVSSDFMDTGQIGEIKFAPFLLPNFVAFDGTTEYEKEGVHKALYAVYSAECPSMLLAGSDANHFKLVDLSGRYAKGDNTNPGELGSESLPNVKGSITGGPGSGGTNGISVFTGQSGAFTGNGQHPNKPASFSSASGNSYNTEAFSAATGQTNADGTYIPEANSTYKNGAKVNPDNFTGIWQARYRVDKIGTEGSISVDDVTIEKNSLGQIQVKDDGITKEKIANSAGVVYTDDEQTLKNKTIDGTENTVSNLQLESFQPRPTEDHGKYLQVDDSGAIVPAEVSETIETITDAFVAYSSRCQILDQEVQIGSSGWKFFRIQLQINPTNLSTAKQDEWLTLLQIKDLATTLKISSKIQPFIPFDLYNPRDNYNIELKAHLLSTYWSFNATTGKWDYTESPSVRLGLQIKSGMGLGNITLSDLTQDDNPLVLVGSAYYR